jgi:hypothetical protein
MGNAKNLRASPVIFHLCWSDRISIFPFSLAKPRPSPLVSCIAMPKAPDAGPSSHHSTESQTSQPCRPHETFPLQEVVTCGCRPCSQSIIPSYASVSLVKFEINCHSREISIMCRFSGCGASTSHWTPEVPRRGLPGLPCQKQSVTFTVGYKDVDLGHCNSRWVSYHGRP